MAEFKTLDDAAFKQSARRMSVNTNPVALSARFDKRTRRVVVRLNTGIDFSFDPRAAHGLAEAGPDDFVGVTVEGLGSALHFPRLDADFSVARLLEGFLGPMDWTKQEARAAASRENGKRGGRPKKALAPAA
ncbi:MAG: DUF2442 domain-containing protein [Caulobacter sp.]|nr:DUF2442 domain-containing protein [Caulobacter sp.]